MATYSRLLLSTGGGIISTGQQADQAQNTASILIGLGGTGVHCIRTIKTQVYDRLKADNPGAAVPEYRAIRFLGIDSARGSQRGALKQDPKEKDNNSNKINKVMDLSESEFFFIGNSRLSQTFDRKPGNASWQAFRQRRDLTWLQYEKIDAPKLSDAGAGGIRQIGRFMLMDKASEFVARLRHEISIATRDMPDPSINIHIFSGLSGGTGSGCFLDVCYLVRSIASGLGARTFGYFFLPDVNLEPIHFSNKNVRDFIQKNGYASMQELDYCMNLQHNGGAFTQMYNPDLEVLWDGPPVDMCHLICATDESHVSITNAYDYAMNVTAEYLMDFLTASDAEFDLQQHLSNYTQMINEADEKKIRGSVMSYCIIGAACASVPLREINTYLAAKLFHEFSQISANMPEQADVEDLAIAALAPNAHNLDEIYDALCRAVRRGAEEPHEAYHNDYKYVRAYGVGDPISYYENQTAAKMGVYAQNAAAMMDEGMEGSLIYKFRQALRAVIRDIRRGPAFAYHMISSGEKVNFLKIIDNLEAINNERLNSAEVSIPDVDQIFQDARMDFETRINSPFGNAKRFMLFEDSLLDRETLRLETEVYNHLKKILSIFRGQVLADASGFYARLNRVTDTLINTFEENRQALSNVDFQKSMSSFTEPMMTIEELEKPLNDEIARLSTPDMLQDFMELLLNNPDEWISEDESRISHLVTDFFLETAFRDFANRTITRFLRDKYQVKEKREIRDEELSGFIYNEWMVSLTQKARPLFDCDNNIWNRHETGKLAFLSYPQESAPITAAAQRMHENGWNLKRSALTDRIFVMSSACGIPLSAYNNCTTYERMLYSARTPGRHYYEGKPVNGQEFSDWWALPSVRPQSLLNPEGLPPDLASLLLEARELYQRACQRGVLDRQNRICKPAEEELSAKLDQCQHCEDEIVKVQQVLAEIDDCRNSQNSEKFEDIEHFSLLVDNAQKRVSALRREFSTLRDMPDPSLIPSGMELPNDGNHDDAKIVQQIQEDHFVSSPAMFFPVRRFLDDLDGLDARVEKISKSVADTQAQVSQLSDEKQRILDEQEAKKKDEELRRVDEARMLENYCDALFTGVIVMNGSQISYTSNLGREFILSQVSDKYPFNKIPIYQGFLSYQNLEMKRRDEIKKGYQELAGRNDPQIRECGLKMKEELSLEKLRGMARLAQSGSYKEQFEQIYDFLEKFQEQFGTFCSLNGI